MQTNNQDSLTLDDQSTVSIPTHGIPNSPPPSEHDPKWSTDNNILTHITENKLWVSLSKLPIIRNFNSGSKTSTSNDISNNVPIPHADLKDVAKDAAVLSNIKTQLNPINNKARYWLLGTKNSRIPKNIKLQQYTPLSHDTPEQPKGLLNSISNAIIPVKDVFSTKLKNTFSLPVPRRISEDKLTLHTSKSNNDIPTHTEYDSGDLNGFEFTEDFYEKDTPKHVPSSSLETVTLDNIELDRIDENIPSNPNVKEDTSKTNVNKPQISYLQYSLVGFKSADLAIDIHNCYKNPTYDILYNIASDIIIIPIILTGFTKETIGITSLLSLYTWYETGLESTLYSIGHSVLYMSASKLATLLGPIGYAYTAIMIGSTAYHTTSKAYFSYCTHYAENENACKINFYLPWFNAFEWLSEKTDISYFNTKTQEYQDIISSLEKLMQEHNIISDTSSVNICDDNSSSCEFIENDTSINISGDIPA